MINENYTNYNTKNPHVINWKLHCLHFEKRQELKYNMLLNHVENKMKIIHYFETKETVFIIFCKIFHAKLRHETKTWF